MKARFVFLLVIAAQSFLYGCATAKGPLFKEVPLAEHVGKAIVYFYRNSKVGSFYTLDLRINDDRTLPLPNKGYHLLILNPGTYTFAVSYKSKLDAENTFTLEGNKAYYIRYHADVVGWDGGFLGRAPIFSYGITSVPRDQAMKVLRKCQPIEK